MFLRSQRYSYLSEEAEDQQHPQREKNLVPQIRNSPDAAQSFPHGNLLIERTLEHKIFHLCGKCSRSGAVLSSGEYPNLGLYSVARIGWNGKKCLPSLMPL